MDNYLMEYYDKPFKELKEIYQDNFSLGYLNVEVNKKFALISLICILTKKLRAQKPDMDYYKVIMNLTKNNSLPDKFIKALAIICEDFAYGCEEFPDFNIKNTGDMAKTVQNILNEYLPF